MIKYPIILCNDNTIEISASSYGESTKQLVVEFVLDFNRFREVIGIEILNLKTYVGIHCLEIVDKCFSTSGTGLRYSYDDETDSFYLQISDESSTDQATIDGLLLLNERGQILGFKITPRP